MNLLNQFNIFSFARKVKRPLILDGAMGSLLESKKLTSDDPAWSAKANIKYPDEVLKIHKAYIDAGADIITTNTFRTNPYSMKSAGISNFKKYLKKSVKLAFKAKQNFPILVAGSNAPAEDCYQSVRTITKKELEYNHRLHIDALMEEGCHFILNETQSHFDEIKIITNYCDKNNIPYLISIYFSENLTLLSGEKISEIISFLKDTNVLLISFNCIPYSLLNKVLTQVNLPSLWGFYLNCFRYDNKSSVTCSINPVDYLIYLQEAMVFNPSMVGACCGSNPDFIRLIKSYIDGRIKH